MWHLIDLDASCRIASEAAGSKVSTAYVPPEMAELLLPGACKAQNSLISHPSFDVWSLGCILYQLCNAALRPLLIGDRDDNLPVSAGNGEDSLEMLAEWSPATKSRKLSLIEDPRARSLLLSMLAKEPAARPSLASVLEHPFLSGKSVKRMPGEPALFDVFISYRVAADVHIAERLYHLLREAGLRVWLDRFSLNPGEVFEDQFCDGLVSSAAFIALLSKEAINSPSKPRQNFSLLTSDSPCDSVLLEHTMALELHAVGLVERIIPLFIGDIDSQAGTLVGNSDSSLTIPIRGNFFSCQCLPTAPDVCVTSVREKVAEHMLRLGLGVPEGQRKTVRSALSELIGFQGFLVEGNEDVALRTTAAKIALFFPGKGVASPTISRRKTNQSGVGLLFRSNSSSN